MCLIPEHEAWEAYKSAVISWDANPCDDTLAELNRAYMVFRFVFDLEQDAWAA